MDNITKSELIAKLAERYPQLAARDAEFAVKTVLDAMAATLARGQRIEIRGFGTFSLNIRPARTGRNPKSGEKVIVPEKRVPHFKPGKELRELVDHRTDAQKGIL
jgi:integration host factor subunit beta